MMVLFLFLVGGLGYGLLEILWRGYTHWSMLLTGGICLVLLYSIQLFFQETSFAIKCLLGALMITGVEFLVGVTVNLGLGLRVWDYSQKPFNLMGQICLPYSVLWFLLCIPLMAFLQWLTRTF